MEKEIYTTIPQIIGDIEAVSKAHKNELQKYMFRSIDDVYNAVNKALSKYKASISVSYEIIENELKARQDNKVTRQVVLLAKYKVYAGDGSFIECSTIGEANDTSDKAFNKAMSAAYKYFMFQTFCIPTEEEKDTEYKSPENIPTNKPNPKNPEKKIFTTGLNLIREILTSPPHNRKIDTVNQFIVDKKITDEIAELLIKNKELDPVFDDYLCQKMRNIIAETIADLPNAQEKMAEYESKNLFSLKQLNDYHKSITNKK